MPIKSYSHLVYYLHSKYEHYQTIMKTVINDQKRQIFFLHRSKNQSMQVM